MNNELVSVVMCTYNGSRFVTEQLESICLQTHTNLEIIIVDDASTDTTYTILEGFAVNDPRIQLYRNEHNLGFNLNFNRACALTTGSYIAVADQDDIWELNKLSRMLTMMIAQPDTLLLHCISARFEQFGKFHLKSPKLVNYSAGQDMRNFFVATNFISGHNMLLTRSLLQKALPFPKEVYYDWWLAAVACCNGKIRSCPEILVWHRMHDSNATGAAKPPIYLYKRVQLILPFLLAIPGIKKSDKEFGERLLAYYKTLNEKAFSLPLFIFLLRHASIIFSHKKRQFPWISYLKHSFLSAKAGTVV